ncbi:MAG TPA: energy-coupling factor ABC transporter ATP-binding protein [Bryobacteraceae bacterium]|nr:energy-coupling factor ABC transporter ATP-binding protein [Bryobacteraceae bacterium]
MTPLIEVHDLSFRYDDGTQALEDIHFALQPGETVALLGANGSGKTTFVLQLNGILRGEGSVTVCGLPVNQENLAAIRSKIGMVFQDADEQLFMPTVLEDVTFGPLNQGLPEEEAVARGRAALERAGLLHAAHKAPYHLSAGEKRQVALAGVLAMQPEILVLDEPTTFLDPPALRNLVDLLRDLPQAKLIVTHNTRFAAALAGRAVFFEKGKLVAEGPVDQLVQRYDWSYSPLAAADLRYSAQRRF